MRLESSGKPDAGKLARPVWGWGQGVIPWPTPHAGPADTAATRIDFGTWLETLPARVRKIATFLATGETTMAAAQRFRLSPSRISQLRRHFYEAWHTFQGVLPLAAQA